MSDMNYDIIGRFIYGAQRHNGDETDIANWIADDVGLPRDTAGWGLYEALFAKYPDQAQLEDNVARFLATLQARKT
jgi:hypothetical protein